MIRNYCRCPQTRCNSLAIRFLNGDREAGDELFQSLQSLIHTIVARILGPNHRSEWSDATQACYLQCVWALRRWRQECPCCCFIATCTARKCINFSRDLDKHRHLPLSAEVEAILTSNSQDSDFIAHCEQVVQGFPKDYQLAWQHYMNGMATAEIGENLNLSERSVYYRLASVRLRLAEGIG